MNTSAYQSFFISKFGNPFKSFHRALIIRTTLLIFLLGFFKNHQLHAQTSTYIPLLDGYRKWKMEDRFMYYDSTELIGDSILNGKKYRTSYIYNDPNLVTLIREDTALRKVYMMDDIWGGNNELLLYDFSLKAGDTLDARDYENLPSQNRNYYIVDSTGLINTLAGQRKCWYLHTDKSSLLKRLDIRWIEGIGCNLGLHYLQYNLYYQNYSSKYKDSPSHWLICAYKDSSQIYYNDKLASLFPTCDSTTIPGFNGIDKPLVQTIIKPSIYPNPVLNSFSITGLPFPNTYTFYITNNFGQILKRGILKEASNATEIGFLQNGFYFMYINSETAQGVIPFVKFSE
jgi:hypothetical protein